LGEIITEIIRQGVTYVIMDFSLVKFVCDKIDQWKIDWDTCAGVNQTMTYSEGGGG